MGTNQTIPGRWSVEPRTRFDIVILLQKWHQPIMTLQEIVLNVFLIQQF